LPVEVSKKIPAKPDTFLRERRMMQTPVRLRLPPPFIFIRQKVLLFAGLYFQKIAGGPRRFFAGTANDANPRLLRSHPLL
jgi:hypothetical protein